MLTSNLSIISIVVPHVILIKIVYLWTELVNHHELEGIYFSENNYQNSHTNTNSKNYFQEFHLFISPEIQALLLVEKKIQHNFYQISITLEPHEILDFCELSEDILNLSIQTKDKLQSILNSENNRSHLQQYFLFTLLKILSEYLIVEEYIGNDDDQQSQTIDIIIKNKIAQEKILHQITRQIQQDLDPLMIVKSTLEQVQSLLEVDRALIYQINVPVKPQKNDKEEFIDLVTYEAKSSPKIASVLHYKEETCFQNKRDCLNKYLNEFCLVVDDISQSNLDNCLKKKMTELQVKAKMALPIIVQNKLWGLLIVHQCLSSRQWQSSEINFLQNIAEYLALAIYQYKSYQKVKEQRKLLQEQIDNKAQQLKDALIVAQVANQSKTEFLGSISHELRTPLTCVIGLSGTMLHWLQEPQHEDLSLEKRMRYLEMIQDSGRKLLQLVNNVLDFADLEAGKSLLNIQPFSLEVLARMIESSGKDMASHHGVNFILDYQVPPELDQFNADEERVYQILLNLVDNAIKFTPEGGSITVQIRRNISQVIFQVKDTGIGINREQIPLLFTQFKQLENYRNRRYSGTGLGLALTKHLVELHAGIIEVESLINHGSIFTVLLPNSQEKVKLQQLESETVLQSQEITTNKTIVIICNDEEIGTLLCELLTAADYQIIWLLDEQEALIRIRLIKPAIVILEQEHQISLKITKRIISQMGNAINLIAIKKEIKKGEWEELLSVGVSDYLLTPVQPRILLQKIGEIITRQQISQNIIENGKGQRENK